MCNYIKLGVVVKMKDKEKKELLEYLKWYKQHVESERFIKHMKAEASRDEMESYYNIKPKIWKLIITGAPFK